ncbi:MAG: fatty acid hydroxylase [Nevskia sp.]|nr:fatty acid hydroxylase [Nevskia sp.]
MANSTVTLSGAGRPFVSNSRDSVRMFERDWMEAMSKVHWSAPLIVFAPLILGFVVLAVSLDGLGALSAVVWFALGLIVWTPIEYVLHRWVFHFLPSSSWGQRLHFIFHGVHHDYPNDARRLVMPPSVSLPIAAMFYGLFWLLLPRSDLDAFFAGFLAGYLIYDMMHYAVHHATFRAAWLKALKRHHMQHHFVDATHGYGVSSPLWDVILGSLRRNRTDKATQN